MWPKTFMILSQLSSPPCVFQSSRPVLSGTRTVVKKYECMALDKAESRQTEVRSRRVPDSELSDHALIEATKSGDERAFATIVGRYRNPITNYLYRFLNDYEEAV